MGNCQNPPSTNYHEPPENQKHPQVGVDEYLGGTEVRYEHPNEVQQEDHANYLRNTDANVSQGYQFPSTLTNQTIGQEVPAGYLEKLETYNRSNVPIEQMPAGHSQGLEEMQTYYRSNDPSSQLMPAGRSQGLEAQTYYNPISDLSSHQIDPKLSGHPVEATQLIQPMSRGYPAQIEPKLSGHPVEGTQLVQPMPRGCPVDVQTHYHNNDPSSPVFDVQPEKQDAKTDAVIENNPVKTYTFKKKPHANAEPPKTDMLRQWADNTTPNVSIDVNVQYNGQFQQSPGVAPPVREMVFPDVVNPGLSMALPHGVNPVPVNPVPEVVLSDVGVVYPPIQTSVDGHSSLNVYSQIYDPVYKGMVYVESK